MPAPLTKRAEDVLPLELSVLPHDGRNWQRVSVSLGRIAHAELLRAAPSEPGANGEPAAAAARALVLLNPPAEAPPASSELPTRDGLTLRGKVGALDLDAWRAASGSGPEGGQSKIDLEVGVLDLFGKRLRQVEVRAGSDVGGWSADVSAAELEGNFEVGGRELGRAEIGARPVPGAWEIDKLVVLNPHGELRGKGTRKLAQGVARTSLAFDLKVTDVGKYLARIGYPNMVDGARARLDGSLAWQGEPQRIDYPSLEGELKLRVDDGQFLEMEPGLGKLVGLISLQQLPKRITLDFRDVFSDGFKFDRISSSIATRRGVMSTDDFEMRGPAAEVDMRGRTDLAAETQDLHVKIVPSVSDTASAAVAILNPLFGAAALLAQRALQNPLGQMLAYEYSITGSWADPQIKKLGVQPQPGGGEFTEKP
ncbi:MAG: AsmA-like C-terminal region-containing protein [bacterium]